MDILKKAILMLSERPLCDHCLGRQFALLGRDLENKDRGRAIKLLLTMKSHKLMSSEKKAGVDLLKTIAVNGSFDPARGILEQLNMSVRAKKGCYLCEGKFKSINTLAAKAARTLEGYEFATLLVGIELPLRVAEREDEFKAHFHVTNGENMRSQWSRTIGKRLFQIAEKEVDHKNPDIVVVANPFTSEIKLRLNPLYVSGKYRKLARGIPQSRWLCRECDGEGCESCGWTGKRYEESVEELVGLPLLKVTKGRGIAFHGAGREDVDACMLGSGRPFVLEIKEPKERAVDLGRLEQIINKQALGKVEVHDLQLADRDVVRRLKKGETAEKTYRALIEFGREVSGDELERMDEILSDTVIHQQTPRRVLHRRADLIREKYIYKAQTRRLSPNRAEIQIRCEGGLYIKELISGDKGRTTPNVAGILGTEASPLRLDVLCVNARGEA